MISSLLSDPMKSTAVDESLSKTSTNVLFQRIPTKFKINSTEWEMYIKLYWGHVWTEKDHGTVWHHMQMKGTSLDMKCYKCDTIPQLCGENVDLCFITATLQSIWWPS